LANTYLLEVVTPEKVLLSESVVQTTIPGVEGYLGVLAGHTPLMTEIRPGEVNAQLADGRTTSHIVVAGGFVEVTPQRTTILADRAERADEIDITRRKRTSKWPARCSSMRQPKAKTPSLRKVRFSMRRPESGSDEPDYANISVSQNLIS